MSDQYAALASIYDRIGMGEFAQSQTPRLLTFAQHNEWLGRRILDLGCGTGVSSRWFASKGYNIQAVDRSPAMLAILEQALQGQHHSVQPIEADLRELPQPLDSIDMAISLSTMNALESLRELETVFKRISEFLARGKFFIFDMYTIEGLTQRGLSGEDIVYNADDLVVFRRNAYDYERSLCTVDYHIFQQTNNVWERHFTQRNLRAYPVQAVITLLKRYQFEVVQVLDTQLQPFDLVNSRAPRLIYVMKKV
jgi:SAM-dependent methyltransferase